ncbi:MAG: glycosyltransferase family 61 protein [Sphingomonadaceae bacterium]|nr:glycosyltransferase family 61 protein [Sphingomonadaceae bacterium]
MEHVSQAVISPARPDRSSLTHTGAVYVDGRLHAASQRQGSLAWKAVDPSVLPEAPEGIAVEHALYCGHFFLHFGHFLIETLPSLWWARDNHRKLIFHPWFGTLPNLPPFVRVALEALAIDEDRLVFATDRLAVGDLLLPPRGNPMGGEPVVESLGVYRDVAERVAGQWPDSGARKFYVSRRFVRRNMRAVDEHLIENEFVQRGFRVVFPEQLSFAEQVSLVSRAEALAGVRGSALHLSGFMPPGSAVLELTRRGAQGMNSLAAINEALGIRTVTAKVIAREGEPRAGVADIEALSAALDESYPARVR